MALLLKKSDLSATDYNLDLSTTRTINGLSLAQPTSEALPTS
jgi:hypothetical protein